MEIEKLFILSIASLFISVVVLIVVFLKSHIHNRDIVLKREQMHRLEIQSIELEKLKSIASAEEEQMRRIGRYMHDEIGGHLHVLLKLLEQPSDKTITDNSMQKAVEITRSCIQSVRLTSQELVPYFLLNFGLQRTLQTMMEDSNEISGLEGHYSESLDWPLEQVPQITGIQLYRLIQEIYSNLLRHAKPSRISLHLETRTERLSVHFEHNGVGISQDEFTRLHSIGKSLGLKNILYRKELLNAELLYERHSAQSFIHIHIPIHA
jgi:two-component system NarL family sensor kinase